MLYTTWKENIHLYPVNCTEMCNCNWGWKCMQTICLLCTQGPLVVWRRIKHVHIVDKSKKNKVGWVPWGHKNCASKKLSMINLKEWLIASGFHTSESDCQARRPHWTLPLSVSFWCLSWTKHAFPSLPPPISCSGSNILCPPLKTSSNNIDRVSGERLLWFPFPDVLGKTGGKM